MKATNKANPVIKAEKTAMPAIAPVPRVELLVSESTDAVVAAVGDVASMAGLVVSETDGRMDEEAKDVVVSLLCNGGIVGVGLFAGAVYTVGTPPVEPSGSGAYIAKTRLPRSLQSLLGGKDWGSHGQID